MASYLACLLIFSTVFVGQELAGQAQNEAEECPELRCKKGGPIVRFPFYLKGKHPDHCEYPGFELYCSSINNDTILELPISINLSVSRIHYKSQTLDLIDPTGCLLKKIRTLNLPASPFQFHISFYIGHRVLSFFNCSGKGGSHSHVIAPTTKNCFGDAGHSVVALEPEDSMFYFLQKLLPCTKIFDVNTTVPNWVLLLDRFITLNWTTPDCRSCEAKGKICNLIKKTNTTQPLLLQCLKGYSRSSKMIKLTAEVLGSFCLAIVVIAFCVIYKSEKARKEHELKVKKFLEDYKALKPTRYTYEDIKRITDEFSDELGQGAYGTVYKGKLSDEIFVAVKILNSSKGNGEEFINEVGIICKIHHVNVVRLVGYCAEGFTRALVYEYLSNDSLQKFISSADDKTCFSGWKKLEEIAIGIARGIEYLHLGCDQRILHFDIKPHNVLLDDNFNPKISDFGTAKLCSKDQSMVSMTTARGTIGYIAPEVFSRNFGNVSYKSDVYSFGMLLLEMVGGRKNVDSAAENNNETYFPEWIYNLLEKEEDIRIQIEEEEDAKIAKKLAIVGLKCIQWHPVDRPSMKTVVQMLGEEDANLSLPPNPFASAPTDPRRNQATIPARIRLQELDMICESELEITEDISELD